MKSYLKARVIFFFNLGYSCFAMLCWFLLCNEVKQPRVCIYPLSSTSPPHHPHPSRSSQSTELDSLCYIAASHWPSTEWARQAFRFNGKIWRKFLAHPVFYTWRYIYVNPKLPVYSTPPPLTCIHTSILDVCVSISALRVTGVNIASQFPPWLLGSLLYAW